MPCLRTRLVDDVIQKNIQDEQENDVEEEENYCGPLKDKPKDSFQPLVDVKQDFFVLVQPSDEETYPIWLLIALFDIDKDKNLKFLAQYWEPICRGKLHEQE